MFQDHGAVGRIPILIPITWEAGFPIFGENGAIPELFTISSTRPGYSYASLVGSDDFKSMPGQDGEYCLAPRWQFNHEPHKELYRIDGINGYYQIKTDKICHNLTQAPNTITQRMHFPSCEACVKLDISNLNEGDYAGICALQGCYGMVAATVRNGKRYLVMKSREAIDDSLAAMETDSKEDREWEAIEIGAVEVELKVKAEFKNMKDEVSFYYCDGVIVKKIGISHKMYFKMDHFCGCRFGLFLYSTAQKGGEASFSEFIYNFCLDGGQR